MTKVRIIALPNGPYEVAGEVEIINLQGKKIATNKGQNIYLCRCGSSNNKPFCDGTHKKVGFQG